MWIYHASIASWYGLVYPNARNSPWTYLRMRSLLFPHGLCLILCASGRLAAIPVSQCPLPALGIWDLDYITFNLNVPLMILHMVSFPIPAYLFQYSFILLQIGKRLIQERDSFDPIWSWFWNFTPYSCKLIYWPVPRFFPSYCPRKVVRGQVLLKPPVLRWHRTLLCCWH